jgi:Sec-independent protein translocase protein TatA
MDLSIGGESAHSSTVSGRGTKTGRKKRRNRPRNDQRFANFLVFGREGTFCVGLFVMCYALILIILWPLLKASTPEVMPDETPRDYLKHMHVPPSLKEIAHIPGQDKLGEMASSVRKRLNQFRQGRGVSDAHLLDQASDEFEAKRKQNQISKAQLAAQRQELEKADENNAAPADGHKRNGFIVLGMHRSGTSMLSGLLHQSAGYQVGGVRSGRRLR